MVLHTLLRQSFGLTPGWRSSQKAASGSAQIVARGEELRGTDCDHTRPEGMNSTSFHRIDIADNSAERPIWLMGRIIRPRHNVGIQIPAEFQLF